MLLYPGEKELFKMLSINLLLPTDTICETLSMTRGGSVGRYFKKLHPASGSVFALVNGRWAHCAPHALSHNFTFTSNEIW